MKIKFVILALVAFISTFQTSAQELNHDDMLALQERVKIKVEEFENYLSNIVNDVLSTDRRLACVNSALALFIGNGDPYYVEDEYGLKTPKSAVRMQISSVNSSKKRFLSTKKYLRNLYSNVHNYHKVKIESADAVRVDNIYKVGDGQYECMAYFCQKYISYNREGNIIYGDVTRKKVKVHITAIEVPTQGIIFEAKLGDIYVVSTEGI